MTGRSTSPATDCGQRTFPARSHDEDVGVEHRFQGGKEPVDPRGPNIVRGPHGAPHLLRDEARLFGGREISGTGGEDGHNPPGLLGRRDPECEECPGNLAIFQIYTLFLAALLISST